MNERSGAVAVDELDEFVQAYEDARTRDGQTPLTSFLPTPEHPLYHSVLLELVRVEMEFGWANGQPPRLDEYRGRYPQLFQDAADLQVLTFEEFRLRRQAGQHPDPEEYRQRFGIDPQRWPVAAHAGPNSVTPQWGESRVRRAEAHPTTSPEFKMTLRLSDSEQAAAASNGSDGAGAVPFSDPGAAAAFADWKEADPRTACNVAQALYTLPEVGTSFLGFQLIAELGRGAFGRVYLARQGELSDRPVALKVAGDAHGESRTLAQLQHTNIVPVYSVHHAPPFHAVCMPYLGSVTLADVLRDLRGQASMPGTGRALVETMHSCRTRLPGTESVERGAWSVEREETPDSRSTLHAPRPTQSEAGLQSLEGLSYVEAILWLGARLADGLAHAHERGILHRDLKPANILLSDDGQPLLLDFNLSEDTKRRTGASAAYIGGTLPYMAPEHLAAFRDHTNTLDAPCDIYSLGVILYELLTARAPFPARRGRIAEILPTMIEDRGQLPSVRAANPDITPAVEAILHRCLAPDPAHRYQSARQLQEDLERHLKNLPLRHAPEPSLWERASKWRRRHPRLMSSASGAALAAVLLLMLGGGLIARSQHLAGLEAAETLRQFRQDVRAAQVRYLDAPAAGTDSLAEIEAACLQALSHYRIMEESSWLQQPDLARLAPAQRQQVQADAGELLFLMSALAALPAPAERDKARQQAHLTRALDLLARAEACLSPETLPRAFVIQRIALLEQLGRAEEARAAAAKAEPVDTQSPRDLGLLACLFAAQGRYRQALPLWQQATNRDPQNVWTWYGLGDCYDHLERPAQSAACYSACIALDPVSHSWHFRLGLAQLKQHEYSQAFAQLDEAVRIKKDHAESRVNRALASMALGHPAAAIDDLTAALGRGHCKPSSRILFIRAQAREQQGDAAGARADRQAGQQLKSADDAGWVACGMTHVANDPQAALADFDRALAVNPRSRAALESKAHILAEKLGRTDNALQVLDVAVALYPEDGALHGARGTLLARQGRREAALRDAAAVLDAEPTPALLFQAAGIYAQTARQAPVDKPQALALLVNALRQGYGHELLPIDHDLDPLRDDPAFRTLLQAARALTAPSAPAGDGNQVNPQEVKASKK